MKTNIFFRAITACLFLAASSSVSAALVTVNFTGYVNYMGGYDVDGNSLDGDDTPTSVPGTPIDNGDRFSGQFTYNTNAVFNPSRTTVIDPIGVNYYFEDSFLSLDITFSGANGSTSFSYSSETDLRVDDIHCCNEYNMYFTLNGDRSLETPDHMPGWDISFFNTGIRLGGDPTGFDFSGPIPTIPDEFNWDGQSRATTSIDIKYQNPDQGTYYVYSRFDSFETVSSVPVPASVWLFGSGLIGLAGFMQKNRQI